MLAKLVHKADPCAYVSVCVRVSVCVCLCVCVCVCVSLSFFISFYSILYCNCCLDIPLLPLPTPFQLHPLPFIALLQFFLSPCLLLFLLVLVFTLSLVFPPTIPLISSTCNIIISVRYIQTDEFRKISDDEIFERCYYALVNGALNLLADGTAQSADDIDSVFSRVYGIRKDIGGLL